MRAATGLVTVLLAVAPMPAAQSPQAFTGVITDGECARGGHAGMRMGPTDAECARLCVLLHDAAYVLQDATTVYRLSDQKTPERFAGQQVRVTGTLDAKTGIIQVEAIAAAER